MLSGKETDRYGENRQLENHMLYSDFPFAIFLGDYKADTANSIKVHSHNYCEIEIVLNGSADHFFEESNYPLSLGDTFVINKGVKHALSNAKELQFYNICFRTDILASFMDELMQLPGFRALFVPDKETLTASKSRLRLLGKELEYAESLCADIMREYFEAQEGFKSAVIARLLLLVVHLSRCYTLEQDVFAANSDRISYVGAYIENHFTTDMSIDFLAEKAGMSTRTFSRAFRQQYQSAPLAYILQLRINRAENLLKHSEKNITDIAYACGFQDSSYFSRMFRKRTGLSPAEYRKCGGVQKE